MPYVTVGAEKDSEIKVSYADYGEGKPVILIHGWPLSHRSWEKQIPYLIENGYRVIAYDRRGFGESYKPWEGYDYDTFAADLDALINQLGLQDVSLVGFSMGGGEIARYIGTYGTSKLAKVVFMSSVAPYLLKTDDNPDGVDSSVFDGMKQGILKDRPEFLDGFVHNFFNYDGIGKEKLSDQFLQHIWDMGVWAHPKATLDCVTAFSETDFRDDIAKCDVPTLVMHGDDDQIVPFEVSGQRTHEMIAGSQLHIVEGGPHGITATHADEVNQKLVEFLSK